VKQKLSCFIALSWKKDPKHLRAASVESVPVGETANALMPDPSKTWKSTEAVTLSGIYPLGANVAIRDSSRKLFKVNVYFTLKHCLSNWPLTYARHWVRH
jgi:hypothetical protein